MNRNSDLATRPPAADHEIATLRPHIVVPTDDLDRFVAQLEQRCDALCDLLLDRYRRCVDPDAELSDPIWVRLSASIRQGAVAQLAGLRRGALPAERPDFALDAVCAVVAIERLDLLLNGYRISHEVLWEAWFELLERSPLQAAARRQLLQFGSDFLFRYEALLSDFAAEDYQRSLERGAGGTEQRRFRAIRELLDGDSSPEPSLDFDLERHHLGVLARGEQADDTIRQLAALLERPLLLSGPLSGVRWAWISGRRAFQPSEERLLEGFQPPPGTHLALGQPAYGEGGFRTTHRQAQRAHWASRFSERRLVLYTDVAATSLAGENPEEARRFIDRELRGLGDDSTDSQRSRETLIAYFECEHNAASAAARLGVHQQTVANRLRAVEERIGRPVGSRRVELELALRLHAILLGIES